MSGKAIVKEREKTRMRRRQWNTGVLTRDHNGLGFSIAGGRGATPFKANDHVCIQIF